MSDGVLGAILECLALLTSSSDVVSLVVHLLLSACLVTLQMLVGSFLLFLVQSAGGLRLTLSSRTGERRREYGVLSLLYSYRTVSVSLPSRKSARLGGTRFLPQEPFSASVTAANPVAVRVPRRIRTLQKPSCSDVR